MLLQLQETYENDIYSLENQENVEEFKPKGFNVFIIISSEFCKQFIFVDTLVKMLLPIKEKAKLPEETDELMNLTMPEANTRMISDEDEDTDSITCKVEESDLNCPQDEMLDLTITDEFDDECRR